MPLSEYEQRVLEQMEQQLRTDDPKLAKTISGSGARRPLHVVLGAIVVLAGVGLLFAGLWNSLLWLSVIGFVVMFGGVLLALRTGPSKAAEVGSPRESGEPAGNVRPMKPRSGGSFMQRLEQRWDKRRDEGR